MITNQTTGKSKHTVLHFMFKEVPIHCFEPNQREHARTRALEPSTEKPRQSEACESQRNKGGNFFSKPHVGLTLSSETIHFLWELLLSTE